MPAWGVAGGGPLNDQQLQNLIDYLESEQLTPEEAPGAGGGEPSRRYRDAEFEDGDPVFESDGEIAVQPRPARQLRRRRVRVRPLPHGGLVVRRRRRSPSVPTATRSPDPTGQIIVDREAFEAITRAQRLRWRLRPEPLRRRHRAPVPHRDRPGRLRRRRLGRTASATAPRPGQRQDARLRRPDRPSPACMDQRGPARMPARACSPGPDRRRSSPTSGASSRRAPDHAGHRYDPPRGHRLGPRHPQRPHRRRRRAVVLIGSVYLIVATNTGLRDSACSSRSPASSAG